MSHWISPPTATSIWSKNLLHIEQLFILFVWAVILGYTLF